MLKNLSMSGFKLFNNFSVKLSNDTVIKGRNGSGKSTIKDALSFVLYGKINDTDRIDGAIMNGHDRAKVSALINLDGKDIIVERTRTTAGSQLTINARPSEQSDIDALFGTYREFVCSNFVGDFMKLAESERRDFLMSLFPPKDQSLLFKEITGVNPEIADLNNLESYEKKIRKELKDMEAERNIIFSTKEIVNSDLMKAKAELNELDSRKPEDYSEKISALRLKINSIESITYPEPDIEQPQTKEIDNELAELSLKINTLMETKPNNSQMLAARSFIESKKIEHSSLKNSLNCPTCKRAYDNLEGKQAAISELESAIIEQFKEYKKLESQFQLEEKDWLDSLTSYRQQESILSNRKRALEAAYQTAMDDARKDINLRKQEDMQQLATLRSELSIYAEKQSERESHAIRMDSKRTQVEELQTRIDGLIKKAQAIDTTLHENIMKAFGPKGLRFREILSQEKAVNALLPEGLEIKFMRENKTNDGFKPAFDVIKDGINYNWLSTGMKLGVDMAIMSLFKKGRYLVLDNAEAYTGKIPKELETRQIIRMYAEDIDFIIPQKEIEAPKKKTPVKKAVAKKAVKSKTK